STGVRPESIVALRFHRSVAFVVAALGVLKAGGSYLPLEACIPATRLEAMLADSGARHALVAPEFLKDLTGWTGEVTALDDDATSCTGDGTIEPEFAGNPSRRAYLIYTSGSTGRPKGVEIEHRSLTNLICFYIDRLSLTARDRTTLLANPVFD